MSNETEIRSGREGDAGDGDGKRAGEQSPLQGRAAFIKNWDWQFVTSFNQGSCERGKAKFGHNSEAHPQVRQRWETLHPQVLTLGEALDFCFNATAPPLFFSSTAIRSVKSPAGLLTPSLWNFPWPAAVKPDLLPRTTSPVCWTAHPWNRDSSCCQNWPTLIRATE